MSLQQKVAENMLMGGLVPLTNEILQFFSEYFLDAKYANKVPESVTDEVFVRIETRLQTLLMVAILYGTCPSLQQNKEACMLLLTFFRVKRTKHAKNTLHFFSFCSEYFREHPNLLELIRSPTGFDKQVEHFLAQPYEVKKLLTLEDLWNHFLIIHAGLTTRSPQLMDLAMLYLYYRERYCAYCNDLIPSNIELCACGGCEIRRYCNVTCQRAHWKEHKPFCHVKFVFTEAQKAYRDITGDEHKKEMLNLVFPYMRLELSWNDLTEEQRKKIRVLRYYYGLGAFLALVELKCDVLQHTAFALRILFYGNDEKVFGKKMDWTLYPIGI
jgi:hypothetical protein